MVDVFISYSRKDLIPVTRLAKAIEAAGYDVWWDAELPPHKSYGEVITDKITHASAAIVVWSPDAAASEWVRAEADMARNKKKLVQTALGDIMPPLPFNQIQYADLGDWQGEDDHSGWKKVKESLRDLCGEREPVASAAAAGAVIPAPAPPPIAPPTAPPTAPSHLYSDTPIATSQPSAPKWPIFAGLGIAAVGIVGSAAFFFSAGDKAADEETAVVDPIALATAPDKPAEIPAEVPADIPAGVGGAPTPDASAPPPQQSTTPRESTQPSFPTGPRSFTGALNTGQSQSFSVGLNANTAYRIIAECDMDCSDIDMWLYDENGNLIGEDVLDDDVPIVDVTPIRSAEFSVRLQMFACSIQPCGFQIAVQPL